MNWSGNGAAVTNAALYFTTSVNLPPNTVNRGYLFENTIPSALVNNQVVGLYGVTETMVAVATAAGKKNVPGPGWTLHREGMGAATDLKVTNKGLGYSNNDKLIITSTYATGGANSGCSLTTNATGGIISYGAFANSGGMFLNNSNTVVSITNTSGGTPNGSAYAATAILNGRANRVHNELLIVYPSMTANTATNTAAFPNA